MKPYYSENNITIIHGDCREVLPQLGIYDLVLTDPPYGVGLEYRTYKDTQSNLDTLIKEAVPLLIASGIVTLLTPGTLNQLKYPIPDWILAWVNPSGAFTSPWGFSCWQPILAYGKDPYLRDGLGSRPDIFIEYSNAEVNGHPCPKPLAIWMKLLKRGSTRKNDKILDPFMGSGTTLRAAKKLGHEALGIEIDEAYCEIAAKSLSQGVLF